MSTTAVVNQKGGVGKTTVSLGLAAVVAESGADVLVVDMDPQANATSGLGVWNPSATMDDALAHEASGSVSSVVCAAGWPVEAGRVVVAPSTPAMAQREHQLATDAIGGQDRLVAAMEGVAASYAEVIIDCPPSLGLLTVNALFAADRVLIVAEPAAWSADGVDQILRNIDRISQRRGGLPEVVGVVVNRLGRTRDGAYWNEQLGESHGDLILDTPIRLRAAVAEAAAQCLPITGLTRSGASEAAAEFRSVAAAIDFPIRREGHQASFGGSEEAATSAVARPAAGLDGRSATSQDSPRF